MSSARLEIALKDSATARRLRQGLPTVIALLGAAHLVAGAVPAGVLAFLAAALSYAELFCVRTAGLRLLRRGEVGPHGDAAQWRLVNAAGRTLDGQLRCRGRFAAALWLEFRGGREAPASRQMLVFRDAVAARDWCLLRRELRLQSG